VQKLLTCKFVDVCEFIFTFCNVTVSDFKFENDNESIANELVDIFVVFKLGQFTFKKLVLDAHMAVKFNAPNENVLEYKLADVRLVVATELLEIFDEATVPVNTPADAIPPCTITLALLMIPDPAVLNTNNFPSESISNTVFEPFLSICRTVPILLYKYKKNQYIVHEKSIEIQAKLVSE
jgi:hypothetical protein